MMGTLDAASVGSARFYQLARTRPAELEGLLLRGTTPALKSLAGFEFRGLNHTPVARLGGVRKFMKGFFWKGEELHGYNCPVRQNSLVCPWMSKPADQAPRRFGYYRVAQVDPRARDSAYPQALLLDYGRGGNQPYAPSRGLRDYLVQVDADNPDLYLGKAYYAVGPLRVAIGSFLLERQRPATTSL